MTTSLLDLQAADLERCKHSQFELALDTGSILLELVELSELGAPGAERRARQFSALFVGPATPVLAQRTYTLRQSTLGTLSLFLVPLGPKAGGMSYEAVFT